MNLIKFLATSLNNGGASYNLNTGELNPNNGYFVSLVGHERIETELTQTTLSDFIQSKIDLLLKDEALFIGTWFDNAKWYLDVSKKYESRQEAIKQGILSGQLAIFDANESKTIKLPSVQAGTLVQKNTYATLKSYEL